jgi:RES domain-containing protein
MSVSTHLWRIGTDTPTYTAEDSSGAGAAATGGRWNAQHSPVIYTSERIALACLETLVHFKGNDLPLNRYLVKITVPISVWKARIKLDPSRHVGWDALPCGKVSVDAGEKWLKEQKSALLVVPSVVVPQEHNVLINPAHADAAKITFEKMEKWRYDTRLKL